MASFFEFLTDVLRVILTLAYPICDYVLDIIYRLFMGGKEPFPPIDNKILLMSATELAEKIRKRQLSCMEVMQAFIRRSKQVHPLINAVVDERYEAALKDAKSVDHLLDSRQKSEEEIARDTPLLGVPFSCKEMLGIKGLTQTNGIYREKGHVAEEDCDAAAMYRKAGAIPLTVTNVPEISMWWDTENLLFGRTKNPYDKRRVVGGSTGGEGALLTSAGAIMGVGTDIGGSIRIPSGFCGIYGHKPTRGVISNWGTFPYCYMNPERKDVRKTIKFVSTGPMCRYASDLPLLLKVLSGYDKRIRIGERVNFRKVKVYYMTAIPGILNSSRPDVRKAILKAAKHFEEEYGIRTTELHLEEMRHATHIWSSKFMEVDSPPLKIALTGGKGSLNLWWELLKSLFGCSSYTFPLLYFAFLNDGNGKDKYYHSCLEKCKVLQRKLDDIFQEDAILLFPTHPEPAPHYMMTIPKLKNIGYTAIFNIMGFPCTAIPAGMSNGLPVGIQAISGALKDHLTIAAAVELEKAFGGWVPPCPVNV